MSEPNSLQTACQQRVVEVARNSKVICCPTPDQALWNAHPRVYLPIAEQGGSVVCPYCGTEYRYAS